MILNSNKTIEIGRNGEIGKIQTWKDDPEDADPGVQTVKNQWIKINSVTNKEGEFQLDYEEITEEEAQRLQKSGDYIDELADALKDKLDSKELLKDALADYTAEERKEILDDIESDEDTEVKNEGGCHKLVVGDKEIMVRH